MARTPPPEVPRGELTPQALGLFFTKFRTWAADMQAHSVEADAGLASAGAVVPTADGEDFGSYRHKAGNSSLSPYYTAGVVGSNGFVTASPTANVLRAFPFVAPKRGGTLSLVAFAVATGAAGNGRIGVYDTRAADDLYPNTLLLDGGGISTGTAGIKSAAASIALTPGALYWLAHVTDTANQLWCLDPNSVTSILGTNAAGAVNIGISVAFTYGALGATFPAGGAYIGSTNPPACFYRVD